MKEGKLEEQKRLKKIKRSTFERQRKVIIKDKTHEEKSLIGINRGQGIKKQEKREKRQLPHQRQLLVE